MVGSFRGRLAPGEHTLQVLAALRNRPWMFGYGTYVRLFCFQVRSAHLFRVTGEAKVIDAAVYERGGDHAHRGAPRGALRGAVRGRRPRAAA